MLFINKLFNSIACLLSFTNLQLVIPGRTWILLYLGRTVYKRLWACLALYTSLPPPGFEHPMITIAQKPHAFRPTLLPPVKNDAPLIETQVTGTTSQTISKEPTTIMSAPATDPTPPSSSGVPQIHEVMDTQRPTSVSSETS